MGFRYQQEYRTEYRYADGTDTTSPGISSNSGLAKASTSSAADGSGVRASSRSSAGALRGVDGLDHAAGDRGREASPSSRSGTRQRPGSLRRGRMRPGTTSRSSPGESAWPPCAGTACGSPRETARLSGGYRCRRPGTRPGSAGRRSGRGPRHDPPHAAAPGRHADADRPRGFAALQTLPEGLLAAMLRRFLRSPTPARSGLSNATPAAEAAELKRVAEQMRTHARVR